MTYKDICSKYNIPKWQISHVIERNNVPRRRFNQKYEIVDDYCIIYIRKGRSFVKCKIDIEDIEKCKSIGIWSLTKAGYVVNCQNDIYLHRFVMDCPNNIEVDHIFHDLLDNRKSRLRFADSSQQKFNTKTRIDNKSGHRGISWATDRQKWFVNITCRGERITKRFDRYDDACKFVDKKYDEWFGEYRYDFNSINNMNGYTNDTIK